MSKHQTRKVGFFSRLLSNLQEKNRSKFKIKILNFSRLTMWSENYFHSLQNCFFMFVENIKTQKFFFANFFFELYLYQTLLCFSLIQIVLICYIHWDLLQFCQASHLGSALKGFTHSFASQILAPNKRQRSRMTNPWEAILASPTELGLRAYVSFPTHWHPATPP